MGNGGVKQQPKGARAQPLNDPERLQEKAPATLELTLDDLVSQPLPTNLPREMFTGPGLLALADLLPVMTAYYDPDLRLQFINRMFAEWLERPRLDLVGLRMVDIIGEDAFLHRKPMVEAALGGEPQFFVAEWNHPTRGRVAAQTQ